MVINIMLFKSQLHFCLTPKVALLTFRLGNHVGSKFTYGTIVLHAINLSKKVLREKFMNGG